MMNDDDTNIYNSFSDSDNNQISQVWGTWEELVLTCAVKRHGFKDWDSVSKEVQSRGSSINASAGNCRLKYQDLKKRFQDSVAVAGDAVAVDEEDGEIPWLEQLRNLRMEELRREVERCDESILSLQLKVKTLEDGNDPDKTKLDLKHEETEPGTLNRNTDSNNRSMNESNSTASVDKTVKACEDPVKMSKSDELEESGTSLGRGKRKGRKYKSVDDSSIRGGSGGDVKSVCDKSQPLIDIIELIRSHPCGSLFESRLRSQETKKYKSLIKQHLDIKIIEKKIEKGSYISSSISFYRDIKLLFTNAIVYFSPSSSESLAAQELRTLVFNEIKKQTETESSVTKQKSSFPSLVACTKKTKTSPSSEETKNVSPVGSTRSSKRTIKKEATSKTEKENVALDKKSVAEFLKRIKKNSPEKGKETTTSKNQKKSDGNVKNTKLMDLRSKKKVEVENKSSSKRKQPKKETEDKYDKQPKKRSRR